MPRSITGYRFPEFTEVYNAPLLKTNDLGYIENQPAPEHEVIVGAGTTINSIPTGLAGNVLVSNGPSVDPSFVFTSTITTGSAENLAGGLRNSLVYQSDPGVTNFTNAITLDPAEELAGVTYVLKQAENTADYPKFTKNLVLGSVTAATLTAADVTTGTATLATCLGSASYVRAGLTGDLQPGTILPYTAGGTGNNTGSITGGFANQIPYQQATSLTGFITPGITGSVLQGNTGGPPSFSNDIIGPLKIISTDSIKANSLESVTTVVGGSFSTLAAGSISTLGTISGSVGTFTGDVTTAALTGTIVTGSTSVNTPGIMTSGSIVTGAVGCGAIAAAGIGCAAIAATGAVASLISVAAPLINGADIASSSSLKDTSQARVGGWPLMRIDNTGRLLGTDSINVSVPLTIASAGTITLDGTAVEISAVANATYLQTDATGQIFDGGSFPPATNIAAGVANQIPVQTAPDTTGFIAVGTTGQVLTGVTGSAPVFAAASGISSGSATNIAGGTANQIPYQSAPGATTFFGPGINGQIIRGNTGGAPSWTSTSTITAGKATNLVGGLAGQVPFQTAVDTSSFTNAGTTAQFLIGGTTPAFGNTITQPNAAPAITINQNGLTEAIRINCNATVIGFRINIPATQIYNSLYYQTNAATSNYTLYQCAGSPVKSSYIGQDNTGDFRIQTDKKFILQNIQGAEIVQESTLINSLTWKQNSAAKVSSISQAATTGQFNVTSDSPIKLAGTEVIFSGSAAGVRIDEPTTTTNFLLFTQNSSANQSGLTQEAVTGNFILSSDANVKVTGTKVTLEAASGIEINEPTTAANFLYLTQDSANKISSLSQEATTGNLILGSDSDIKIFATGKTVMVKGTTAENKLEFSQNAGAKISSISQVATTGVLSVKSDTSLKLDAPTYNLTGVVSAPFLKTDASSNIVAGTSATLFLKPVITFKTTTGTHTFTTGATYAEIWLTGGGGGGAGGSGAHGGGGGGGGATAYRMLTITTLFSTVNLGAGGAAGAYTVDGSAGTLSEFLYPAPTSILSADPGGGGNSTAGGGGQAGVGGTSALMYYPGGVQINNWHDEGCPGGSSYFSGPQFPVAAASTKGAGGQGGTRYAAGEAGGAGVCLIKEYFF